MTGDLAKAAALAPHADAYGVGALHTRPRRAPQLRRWVVKYSSGIIKPQSHKAMPAGS